MKHSHILGPMLGRSAHLAKERMDARLSRYDVTPAQTHTLLCLHRNGGQLLQREVVQYLRVKPSTANGILDRMEEKVLVRRSVNETDARQKIVTLTEKGILLQKQLQQSFDEVEQVMLRGLSAQEQDMFFGCLEKVIENLEEDREV